MIKKFPGIITDIDGVLLRGNLALPRVVKTLNYIRKPIGNLNLGKVIKKSNESKTLPFICLTNGGGYLEIQKANDLNKKLNLKEEYVKFKKEDVLLNFSALRPIIKELQNELTLIYGKGNIKEIVQDCGLQNFITVENFDKFLCGKFEIDNKSFEKDLKNFKFKAILLLNDPLQWEIGFKEIFNFIIYFHYIF